MHRRGYSFRRIERETGINHNTVRLWHKQAIKDLAQLLAVSEDDVRHYFIKHDFSVPDEPPEGFPTEEEPAIIPIEKLIQGQKEAKRWGKGASWSWARPTIQSEPTGL